MISCGPNKEKRHQVEGPPYDFGVIFWRDIIGSLTKNIKGNLLYLWGSVAVICPPNQRLPKDIVSVGSLVHGFGDITMRRGD
jgi:hypothetical protein